jgi:hypothetical protein
MWERVTPADIEQARHQLALKRGATLLRHAEELKNLDTERDEIETLEQLIAAVTEKYTGSTQLETSPDKQEPTQIEQDAAPQPLEIIQEVSPSFGIPVRRLLGR